ncbi:HDR066Wp [Eremothecium sinecaudum]|uniref:HDR066Wp n=1 Tax=Eremothecium sinecaudum TaxID=45286 RepID=A0A109UZH6_9SACH|nr:HDR066Wp [Eremothecium sinecaudum]AMD20808.1 HDR066Wp [Eremothecium sinecaudum]
MSDISQYPVSIETASIIDQGSANVVRTLPRTTQGTEDATPKTNYKDKLWTEIDVLDDVKRMAQDNTLYKGLPDHFEAKLGELRKAHAVLLNAIKDSFVDDLKTQQEKIMFAMDKIQSISHN